jgi:crotonobetainyl-CoA:carnitine CoA-transferase CaiB-like acyl-CoA transferase
LSEKLQPMLSGVRVVDLAHMLAGGYGSMLLGDLGAEMIKIEPLEIGDRTRLLGPPFVEGESGYFLGINRNKKSVALDLRTEDGRQVLYDLVRVSDVVFDNFRPGVMEEMGCGYEAFKEINPRIIYCALSGFGETGPYQDRPAFDLAVQALSGAMSITGEPGRPPVRMGVPMGDLGGSLFCALAMDCLIALLTYVGQYYLLDGQVPGPMGSAHVSVVPYQAFPTQDIYIVVAVFVEKFWQALCRVLGAEELADDPRFADNDGRRDHREELIPILEDIFRTRPGEEWLRLLTEAGVPSGPINTLDRVFADPQVAARNMVVEINHPKVGSFRSIGNPIKTLPMPEGPFEPPPMHGQHTQKVLREVLGYSSERVRELIEKGVIKK